MVSTMTSSPVTGEPRTQIEPKHPLMPYKLLEAAIDGNETYLKQLLGLNNEEDDHPPHTKVSVEDLTPMEPSDCLRSTTGMANTILHILSAYGHTNLVSTICKKDSSLLKALNVRNEICFHHAARFGHANTILKLIECAKLAFSEDGLIELLKQKNCLGETVLHEAARYGRGDIVSTLMEEDLELAGLVNDDSVSPLYLATARGSLDIVKIMLAKMLHCEITPAFYSGPKNMTALHAAVLQDTELTGELLHLYSEPLGKGKDETGRTPLHFVASTGNHNTAKLLLDKDLSLAYIQDSNGSFPVHTAVRMGHVKMIVVFLQRCLDSGELLDHNGRNFLHIAIEVKKEWIFFELLKDSKNKLFISHWKEMFNRMANTIDSKGNTPLHLAAEHESIDVMLSLLKEKELDLTLQNKEGLTAVDILVIKLRKTAKNTQNRNWSELYSPNRGVHFSTGWFQYYTKEQMPKTESSIKDQVPEIEAIRGTMQDHISTADERVTKKSSEGMVAKAQLVGLGSIFIATVTFAAAFTLPGGTNQDTGIPILGRKYVFKAFVLADFSAFCLSFLSSMILVYSSSDKNPDRMERNVAMAMSRFAMAARCMVMALALGLYLVLAPIGNTGAVVLAFSVYLCFMSTPYGALQQSEGFRYARQIPTRFIKPISIGKYISSYNYLLFALVWSPFVVIFLFALI